MMFETGEKPHVCSICGKTFSQSGSRNVHMKKRHGRETGNVNNILFCVSVLLETVSMVGVFVCD